MELECTKFRVLSIRAEFSYKNFAYLESIQVKATPLTITPRLVKLAQSKQTEVLSASQKVV